MNNQPESPEEQHLQNLVLNLLRIFGRRVALPPEHLASYAMSDLSDNLSDELAAADADTLVTDLCDEIADECQRIRKIQHAMGYNNDFSKSA